MRIAFVSSEVVPYSKTGGLADVSGALPKFLASLGHDVAVFTPLYKEVREKEKSPLKKLAKTVSVPVGPDLFTAHIWTSTLPDSKVPVYFIAYDPFFNREGLYGDAKGDYTDNCSRFVLFSRAVLEALKALNFKADIIHSNDWQSGLVPIYSRLVYASDPAIGKAANVYTVHNLAYQGKFWHWDMPLLNLGWEHFNYKELEFFGNINFMKGGIVFADTITTVSPTYAKEIQEDEELGAGLQGVLKGRTKDVAGILNGIDDSDWSPEKDALIAKRYSASDVSGKADCKKALQKEAGLAQKPRVPLIGMITRLVDQKGLDIIAEAIGEMMKEDLQMVVLGTGLEKYHKLLTEIAAKYPKKCAVFLKFDNRLAHAIEAGADMFLMPSRYEPCGLNQLYSLKYGTVPIVRATGGLADTVTDTTEESILAGTATGFSFVPYEGRSLLAAVHRALTAYSDATLWAEIAGNGMKQDWSWTRSASEYARVYKETIEKRGKKP
jgi:starch synthase